MRLLYRLGVNGYFTTLKVGSVFNDKANKLIKGRKRQKNEIVKINVKQPLIWFHCASLGEFEQGKPVMEGFKQSHPEWKLLVTFFSPSGYEVQKDFSLADFVYYLPFESTENIRDFMAAFKPKLAVFIKYEFWYDYMIALKQQSVPMIFISATFRENQPFFKSYGRWFLKQLKNVEMFFVQDLKSQNILLSYGIEQVEVSGDTRFDRVLNSKFKDEEIPFIESFKDGNKVLIFGSAWQMETEFALKISRTLPVNWKVIYAPHEISELEIDVFISKLDCSSVRITNLTEMNSKSSKILIVNTIGQLARLYKYSDVAFVGGGFNDGIHNILEPLAFGSPVFFGGLHQKFWEGESAIKNGVGFEVTTFDDFQNKFNELSQSKSQLSEIQEKSTEFIQNGAGATKRISEFLNKLC